MACPKRPPHPGPTQYAGEPAAYAPKLRQCSPGAKIPAPGDGLNHNEHRPGPTFLLVRAGALFVL